VIGVGFRFYDWLSRHRNDGVTPELHLPKTRLETPVMTARLFPGITREGLTGGALWYDYQTTHAERLTWAIARAAAESGATLANYVEALGQPSPGQVRLRDTRTGDTFDVAARAVVLTAAEGMAALYGAFELGEAPPLIRAMNLLIECARPTTDVALVAPSSSGRMLTAVPWRGHVLVGTSQSADAQAPGTRATEADVDAFLAEANSAFPFLAAGRDQIRVVHDGLVPATAGPRGLDLPRDFDVRDHAAAGQPHVVSIIGAKYTTARRAAEVAVDRVCRALGRPAGRSVTAERVLPHAGIADVEGQLIEACRAANVTLPPAVQAHLSGWYGTEAPAVFGYALASPFGLATVTSDSPVLLAELAFARDHAMAVTPDDAIYRRTSLGGTGRVPAEILRTVAKIWE
jgi:glycerol-3-phosphate dehydrogenase